MADDDFDFSEFTDFENELLDLANNTTPKETRKHLMKEGLKLKRLTLKNAKQIISNPKTGNYFKGIKRGKVYPYNGNLSVRVYNSAPHAHLIEYGHRQVTKDGKEVGFVQGKYIFEKSEKEFENTYYNDTEKFIDDVIDKGLH